MQCQTPMFSDYCGCWSLGKWQYKCREHRLCIAGSWFHQKDTHHYSWIAPDGATQKEIDHVLVNSKYRCVRNSHIYRGLECGLDHHPVIADLALHFRRNHCRMNKAGTIDHQRLVSHSEIASTYVCHNAETLQSTDNPSATIEEL